jgi:hypothetical protein
MAARAQAAKKALTFSMNKVKETKGAVGYVTEDGVHNIYLRKDELTDGIPDTITVEVTLA